MFQERDYIYYQTLGIYERSRKLVEMLFKDKLDKGHSSYMIHLEHVSMDFHDERKKSMALMHDVLEDTEVTKDDLKRLGYDEEFINVLEILTNTWDSYEEYIDKILKSNNKDALEIKIKDLLHNMDLTRVEHVTKKDLQRSEKYIKAYLKIIEKMEGDNK